MPKPFVGEIELARRRYLNALLAGDSYAAVEVVDEVLAADWDPESIYIDLLGQTLARVGDMWHSGDVSVVYEHLATQVTLQQINRIGLHFSVSSPDGPRSLVSGVESDEHWIGALVFAELMKLKGWRVHFMGRGLSGSDLGQAVESLKPDVVGLSATMPESVRGLESLIAASRVASEGTFIVVGGAAVGAETVFAPESNPDLVSLDIRATTAELARRFGGSHQGEPT